MEAGSFLEEASRKKDLKRLSKAEKAHSLAAKKRRKELKFKSSVQEQKTKDNTLSTLKYLQDNPMAYIL